MNLNAITGFATNVDDEAIRNMLKRTNKVLVNNSYIFDVPHNLQIHLKIGGIDGK